MVYSFLQPQLLTKAMVRVSTASQIVLERMSIASSTLANLWDAAKLAEYFLESLEIPLGAHPKIYE
jgi:hypothetical protein